MQTLEQQIARRYPHWFRGRRAVLAKPLLRSLGRWSGLDHVFEFLASHADASGFALIDAAMDYLNLRYDVDAAERKRIPSVGRLLIVANHPSGALDALSLLHLVGSVRRDVRIVANDLLGQVEGLRELLLPVRILGGKPSEDSIEAIHQALREEQCVIVFPAGEVSR
ncbi:MAG TPA: 1-acyl-sn-glycerol-3-phosphate acyltransferase, partial [Pseudoxanthomonas sp.]|nr:1-acyl-sn-glycerol-3-phosphate acyltransferase [Pseudoxanthomonas sp.]